MVWSELDIHTHPHSIHSPIPYRELNSLNILNYSQPSSNSSLAEVLFDLSHQDTWSISSGTTIVELRSFIVFYPSSQCLILTSRPLTCRALRLWSWLATRAPGC